jgi:acyl dehydratase
MYKVDTKEPPARRFEEFPEGTRMPEVTQGPMTAGHQVRWAAACDNYASEFHHDAKAAREAGLPGLLLSGPFMACIMLAEITHWLGRNARIVSFWDRNTATTMPGDMAIIQASVKKASVEGGKGRVEIDCQIVNQDGKVTTPGGLVAEFALGGAQ